MAKTEAQELYDVCWMSWRFKFKLELIVITFLKEGKGKMGTDESVFIRILCSRSFKQLNETFLAYEQTQGHSIEKSIKDEMSGDLEEACLTIGICSKIKQFILNILINFWIEVKAVKNKPLYFAEKIHESMKGLGTRDDDLIRLLICRAEVSNKNTSYSNIFIQLKNFFNFFSMI